MAAPTIDQVLRPIASICMCRAKPSSCDLHIQARKIATNLNEHIAATRISKEQLFEEVVAVTQLEQMKNNSIVPIGINRNSFIIALIDECMTIMHQQQQRVD